ncbi:MAG: hypothetical protein HY609_04220 [Deltaproteobacteria bacterium]|nr:hypothetical protein [Deltaproteobacteria bacterium]
MLSSFSEKALQKTLKEEAVMLDKTPPQTSFWDTRWIEHLIDPESFEWHFRRVVRPLMHDGSGGKLAVSMTIN